MEGRDLELTEKEAKELREILNKLFKNDAPQFVPRDIQRVDKEVAPSIPKIPRSPYPNFPPYPASPPIYCEVKEKQATQSYEESKNKLFSELDRPNPQAQDESFFQSAAFLAMC